MVTHLLADLGWVDLIVPQADGLYCSCGAAQARQWNIPNPSQPNPVREEMGHPVLSRVITLAHSILKIPKYVSVIRGMYNYHN